jgi:hypothetical protein
LAVCGIRVKNKEGGRMFNLQDNGVVEETIITCPNCSREIESGKTCNCFFDEI